MPDVARSNSQRSDSSLRPRVSFNRDVHIKRIVPREATGTVAKNGNGSSVNSVSRKEYLKRPKRDFQDENFLNAVHELDKNSYSSNSRRAPSLEKFFTLPRTRKEKAKISDVLGSNEKRATNKILLPKTLQKQFKSQNTSPEDKTLRNSNKSERNYVQDKSRVRRSVSSITPDTHAKFLKSFNDHNLQGYHKKQLSPIIEVNSCDDPFHIVSKNKQKKDNDNGQLGHSTGKKASKNDNKIVVIDIDEAENINKPKKVNLKSKLFGKRLKVSGKKNTKCDEAVQFPEVATTTNVTEQKFPRKESIENSGRVSACSNNMIHSSQTPAERPPLTRGHTVDLMVRRLSRDVPSSATKPNIPVTPHQTIQHNNNKPFSYTHGAISNEDLKNLNTPVVYAHVVCNSDENGLYKETVHTSYNKRHFHSDSDEGLGNDEYSIRRNQTSERTLTHFGDNIQAEQESPIMPKYRGLAYTNGDQLSFISEDSDDLFGDARRRGCADGMESRNLQEQSSRHIPRETDANRNNLSVRRDLLESRIQRKINDAVATDARHIESSSSSPSVDPERYRNKQKYFSEAEIFTSTPDSTTFNTCTLPNYKSFPKNESRNVYESYVFKQKNMSSKNLYKSTPEIYIQSNVEPKYEGTFHNSLQRNKRQTNTTKVNKLKSDNIRIKGNTKHNSATNLMKEGDFSYGTKSPESEDEGFASSLLIGNEKQHVEDAAYTTPPRPEYDSDATYFQEDGYNRLENREAKSPKTYVEKYVSRERSIDDGSHYDPRIDKEFANERATLKRNQKKPHKPERKSGFDKVKQLFTRDSKKKKEEQRMVREESLLARYTEYKGIGSSNHQNNNKGSNGIVKNGNRRQLSSSMNHIYDPESGGKPSKNSYTNWFKSLDRLSTNKNKRNAARRNATPQNDRTSEQQRTQKNFYYFGDTDLECCDNLETSISQNSLKNPSLHHSQISEQSRIIKNDKSLLNGKNVKSDRPYQKPPISPSSRVVSDSSKDHKRKNRKHEFGSVESSTEGDESHQSQRSVVYLHAATVGDIPHPVHMKYGQRALSKEELASESGRLRPQIKTLSRSFSVLTPWKPRHPQERLDLDYASQSTFPRNEVKENRKENSTNMKNRSSRNTPDSKRFSMTLDKSFKTKDNVSKSRKEESTTKSLSTLYKKKENKSREKSRYSRDKEENRSAVRSMESLDNSKYFNKKNIGSNRDISRSVSMPRDAEKKAGWYKMNKKTSHNTEYIMQRV